MKKTLFFATFVAVSGMACAAFAQTSEARYDRCIATGAAMDRSSECTDLRNFRRSKILECMTVAETAAVDVGAAKRPKSASHMPGYSARYLLCSAEVKRNAITAGP